MCHNTWKSCMVTAGAGQLVLEKRYMKEQCNPSAPSRVGMTTFIYLKIASKKYQLLTWAFAFHSLLISLLSGVFKVHMF